MLGLFFVFVAQLFFVFVARLFVAFRAGALPAGERLVAGLSRLDLLGATRLRADDVVDGRELERDASFFTLLVVGLLMRNAPRFQRRSVTKIAIELSAKLSIALAVIQRKNRVCGHILGQR